MKRNGDDLRISVFNTGEPISEDICKTVLSIENTKGYGLYNINERLAINYGKKYGIEIKPEKNGTTCSINIPIVPFGSSKEANKFEK